MDVAKVGNLLAYIASSIPNINLRKLIKIVFLIDERSVIERGLPITWLDYYAWQKGPVAPCVYDVKYNVNMFSRYVSAVKNEEGRNIVYSNIGSNDCILQFSNKELHLIDSILSEFGGLSADDLSNFTHRPGGLWNSVVSDNHIDFSSNGKSDYRIDLRSLILDDKDKLDVYDDARELASL